VVLDYPRHPILSEMVQLALTIKTMHNSFEIIIVTIYELRFHLFVHINDITVNTFLTDISVLWNN